MRQKFDQWSPNGSGPGFMYMRKLSRANEQCGYAKGGAEKLSIGQSEKVHEGSENVLENLKLQHKSESICTDVQALAESQTYMARWR